MLGIHDIHLGGTRARGESKDLHRLSRQDLLELLVGQMHEGDELRAIIEHKERDVNDLNALVDRLKEKLDLKDEQIENLKDKLDLKDAQIEHLKKRLDQKDNTIDTLKRRLDFKDVLIARLSESQHVGMDDLEIVEARERALEYAESHAEVQDEESLDE